MMVHTLHIRGREPLGSAPCVLGCMIVAYLETVVSSLQWVLSRERLPPGSNYKVLP